LIVDLASAIETQVAAENSAEHSLRRYRVEAMGRTKLLPPYREYSPSEIEQKLAQSALDALLFINVEDAASDVYSGSMTFGSASGYTYGAYANAYASSLTVPTTLVISNARITATLVDPVSGQILWKGYVNQSGRNEGWSTKSAARNVVRKVIGKLGRDDLLR